MNILTSNVESRFDGFRIDQYLSQIYSEHSRAYFQKLLKESAITVDDKNVKPNFKVKANQKVIVVIQEAKALDLKAQDIEIDIIYQDDYIAVINKPQGMVVHPAPGNSENTLVNALLAKLDNLSGINGNLRPGIVHRLDKNTSGLLVVAKNDFAHNSLANQIKDRTAKRKYLTIVHNEIKLDKGIIEAPIGRHPTNRKKMAILDSLSSREAKTHFEVIERFKGFTYVEAKLETGRTHQIRVHMAAIGHPVVGDMVYGLTENPFKLQMQALHSYNLNLIHPKTLQNLEFTAPLPQTFAQTLSKLREGYKK